MKTVVLFACWLCFTVATQADDQAGNSAAIVAAFQTAAHSTDPHVRAAAARALCDLGGDSAQEQLFLLLKDKNEIVSAAAAEALAKCGDKATTQMLLDLLTTEVAPTNTATGPVFASSAPALQQFAEMKAEERTIVTIRALSRSRDPRVAPVIIKNLASQRIGVQIAAAIALGRLKERTAVKPLMDILETYYRTATSDTAPLLPGNSPVSAQQFKENHAYLRSACVWALGEIRAPAAKPVLTRALEDDNSLVRDAAKEALEKLL